MIVRRFLTYFVVAMALAVAGAVAFEVLAFRRATDYAMHSREAEAVGAARFVSGFVHRAGDALSALLAKEADASAASTAASLAQLRATSPQISAIALLDRSRGVSAATDGELPPSEVLLPALRHAEAAGQVEATDLWRTSDGRPMVTLVVVRTEGGWRAAMAHLNLQEKAFSDLFDLFGHVGTGGSARVQLLDGRGVALYSTREKERFESVVHGTYFSDAVRMGQAKAMPCHSCHEGGERPGDLTRSAEITAVAPVAGTSWSVTVRERRDELYAPLRDLVFGTVGLVAAILGIFAGAFLLLHRRILRPISRLVAMAREPELAGMAEWAPSRGPVDEEIARLAESLSSAHELSTRASGAAGAPRVDARDASDSGEFAPEPRGLSSGALADAIRQLTQVEPIRAAMLLYRTGSGDGVCVQCVGVRCESAPSERLLALGEREASVTPEFLAEQGILLGELRGCSEFFVRKLRLEGVSEAQLWIGVTAEGALMGPYLKTALDVVTAQVRFVLVRELLDQRLREEHAAKNRLLQHLFEAEDEERRRIAREIHDETGQVLSALRVLLETFPAASDPAAQEARLERAKSLVEQVLDHTDRLIRRLRPAVLDDLGLVEAIRATGHNLLEDAGVGFEFEVQGAEDTALPRAVEVAVYRVFQEAMTNVVRHSGAKEVRASVAFAASGVTAHLEDDGRGLDQALLESPNTSGRWGLLGMRERITQVGGKVAFSHGEGGGLRIDLEVPCTPVSDELS